MRNHERRFHYAFESRVGKKKSTPWKTVIVLSGEKNIILIERGDEQQVLLASATATILNLDKYSFFSLDTNKIGFFFSTRIANSAEHVERRN